MTQQPVLIKIGGNEIDDPAFLAALPAVVAAINAPVIIVHGGGKEISALQQQMGIQPRYVDGVRITDAASLAVVEMVLCGVVNKRLVRILVNGGVDALGMSGADRGIVRAVPMQHADHEMGFTGSVAQVNGAALLDLLARGITPVIAPICLGTESNYNVNADHVAGAVAAATQAERVIFVTNVPGVLVDGQPVSRLTAAEAQTLIEDGTIFGGMIPKVQTALQALARGVPQVVITNLAGVRSGSGTVFVA
ncbi:MAG: acetylglutamate kinase [Anaerolineaceae bacterium]|nr:acetylglutamate kinase [Anaerolineaceae bacterium]